MAMDNNAAERALRPIGVGRRNWLFAGADTGAETLARAMTIIETAKMSGLNPQAYLADVLEEDVDLLQAIIYNDDNLTYGNIITVVTGEDQTTSALTDDGVDELRQMLADARQSAEKWQEFLECFVDDEEVVERVKSYSPR